MAINLNSTRASLILRLQDAADVAAWDEFAAIYSPVIYRVAVRRGFQQADAENLVQEVLFAVAKSLSNWLERDQRGSFRAWLLTIARNKAIDLLTRRATRPFGDAGETAQELLAQIPAPNDLRTNWIESMSKRYFDGQHRRSKNRSLLIPGKHFT